MTPMSMAEIQADKDQLRAEFAMSTRRLEMSVEQMKARTTNQLAEIGKKSEGISRLKLDSATRRRRCWSSKPRRRSSARNWPLPASSSPSTTSALEESERVLAETQSEFAKLNAILSETALSGDEQRIELVTLRTQVEMLRTRSAGL